ncbi:MAG: hypothetical protein KatS3mg105_4108 [Gemmatales bacterium]|nr:MAG: hypothetical protein KatS3mg105_4108 [Gemmatales bacterium]
MRTPALALAAAQVPGLSPGAASLIALARSFSADAWPLLRLDPGALLLLTEDAPAGTNYVQWLQQVAVLERACLAHRLPFVDWRQHGLEPIYRHFVRLARLAEWLASRSGYSQPSAAWAAGLLAPLGWWALLALEPDHVVSSLQSPEFRTKPLDYQVKQWGIDVQSLTRRLCRRWRLPDWLVAVVSQLDLDFAEAYSDGLDERLFRIVQLAIAGVEQRERIVCWSVGGSIGDNLRQLGLSRSDMAELVEKVFSCEIALVEFQPPTSVGLLPSLLELALENRRLQRQAIVEKLEAELDALHAAFRERKKTNEERLRAMKLHALAEFAAGAGHEINNPLAVISGQAQYLLHREADADKRAALQKIIGQAERIHAVLTELRQFARPPQPVKARLEAGELIRDVVSGFAEQAGQKRIAIQTAGVSAPVWCHADGKILRTALACLVRNAIEAAPEGGWVSVRLNSCKPDVLEFVVEDNGISPTLAQAEHLFDPFYSGRSAGRGRGLGLSTAWQLARVHDGDVRYEPRPGCPTRFVLSIPRKQTEAPPTSDSLPANGRQTTPPATRSASLPIL